MSRTLSLAISVVVFAACAIAFILFGYSNQTFASVSVTDEYMATSSAANGVNGAFTTGRLIDEGQGTFGSYVITGANTGVVHFYDATTTDVTKRASNKATSTILIASFPASTAAGTYTFDVKYTAGLYMDLPSGSMPTSTVTYRLN